jgi:hypothetical protein
LILRKFQPVNSLNDDSPRLSPLQNKCLQLRVCEEVKCLLLLILLPHFVSNLNLTADAVPLDLGGYKLKISHNNYALNCFPKSTSNRNCACFVIYLHDKFHIPSPSILLTAMKSTTKKAAILLRLFLIPQK